jgi:hypothetical protein
VAVVHGIQRAEVPVVDQQAGGGVGGDIVFDLREGDRGGGCCSLPALRVNSTLTSPMRTP